MYTLYIYIYTYTIYTHYIYNRLNAVILKTPRTFQITYPHLERLGLGRHLQRWPRGSKSGVSSGWYSKS